MRHLLQDASLGAVHDRNDIRNKYFAGLLAVLIIVSVSAGVLTYRRIKRQFESANESSLQTSTISLSNLIKESAGISVKNRLRSIVETHLNTSEYFWNLHLRGEMARDEVETCATVVEPDSCASCRKA